MAGDPRWTGPPEAIAATFEAGSPASVISNNSVWVTETAHHELVTGVSAVNTAATLDSWQGLGASGSAVAATGLNAGLQTVAGWTAHKAMVTQGAIDAFTNARSSVIPSVVIRANRDEREAMNTANPSVFWAFTPAIVERDIEYFGEHWPHNSGLGLGFSGAMNAFTAALAMPPPAASLGASPAAPAAAGESLAQTASTTGAQDGVSLSSQAAQAAGQAPASSAPGLSQLSSAIQPLQAAVSAVAQLGTGIVQAPVQAAQGFSSIPQSLMSVGGMFPAATAPEAAAVPAVAGPVGAGGAVAGGLGAGAVGGSIGAGAGAYPGAGLTSYTRPASTFEPEIGGRPTGLRQVVFNAGEAGSPTTSAATGGTAMPMAPAGVGARASGDKSDRTVTSARIVVHSDHAEPQ